MAVRDGSDGGDTDTDSGNGSDIDITETPLSVSPPREDRDPADLPASIRARLTTAPESFVRAVEYAFVTGDLDTLRSCETWAAAFGDWAMFLTFDPEDTYDCYQPWGEFFLPARTLVVFRLGYLMGGSDLKDDFFHEAAYCSERDLFIAALEERMGISDVEFEWTTEDDRAETGP